MALRKKTKPEPEPPAPVVVEPEPEPEPDPSYLVEEKLHALAPDLDEVASVTGQNVYARFADNIRNYFGGVDDR